ncbi:MULTISPECIES: histone deacetylase [Marichromatium]|uniref:Acetoin utilization deacetylase AcuC-like enzyme n=1 Tax=Marichromatium gracile TaxID=1048 RepID=A0A4R4AKY7_MARGR|nr:MULTISPECIES: histone deacetylase [Marichromatium]MBK1707575.1 histone deacetylase [Marichromatium gracile]MBO8085215.1 histone deacetylase [Marichromatium sp.]RNE92908.1 histone deacetylase [Marichromatium sp. AB32]TCW39925.1 acetoin utilization deacetylase AcuC-like enzyme [Marichromatium gracile]
MLSARHETGLVLFPAFDWAIEATHPEREERLLYTRDQICEEGLLDLEGVREYRPEPVSVADVQRVHFCPSGVETVAGESHRIAAGGALRLARAWHAGDIERGFALVRPPGHHAQRVMHGGRGFCAINNEAIMIEALRQQHDIRRVAIIDTDCHHGDGTQDIYWHDPDVLFISIHQDGRTLYPGTGFMDEQGGPNAVGATVNIPLPPRTSDAGYLEIVRDTVLPILEDFEPELVINSAGQDNHFADPLTDMDFSARGYAELTRLLAPDLAVLEGGYSIESALPYINMGILLAMTGLESDHVVEPYRRPSGGVQPEEITEAVRRIGTRTRAVWAKREQRQAQLHAVSDECAHRTREIYYDTIDAFEHQHEAVRLCRHCGGALRIATRIGDGPQTLAVHVPLYACDDCRRAALRWFELAPDEGFAAAFLQDRPADRYLIR